MRLYMIRHGQSVGNRDHRHSGWSQFPLTDQGFEDARRAGEKLKGIRFDHVYCSDLMRARQTQETALPGAEAELDPLLREMNVGSLMCRPMQECQEEYGETYLNCRRLKDYRTYGGEDVPMHCARISRFLQRPELARPGAAAVFCHEGSIRCMLDLALGVQHDRSRVACPNGSVAIFEYQDGILRLIAWNWSE